MQKTWTKNEIDYLRENYLEMTNSELAYNLNRTKNAVKSKLNKDLKLIRPPQNLTNEDFLDKISSLVGEEYTFLEPYINSKTDLKVIHNDCGHIYYVRPNNFISGKTRCPRCYGTKLKTQEEFVREMYLLVGDEYTLMSEYENNEKPIDILHESCGNIYKVKPRVFMSNKTRCPSCNGGVAKTQKEFDDEVISLVGDEYVFLQGYINNHTKLKIKHIKCGYVYSVNPSNFLYGKRCPKCNASKGEGKIYEFIKNNYKLEIIPQAPYPELYYKDLKNNLRSDFKVIDSKNNNSFFIEYDGIQHFEKVNWSGCLSELEMEYNLKQQMIKDELKNIYCEENNIELIRIPYWEFDNIEKILINFIEEGKYYNDK